MVLLRARWTWSLVIRGNSPRDSPYITSTRKNVRLLSFKDMDGNGEQDFSLLDSTGWYEENKPRRLQGLNPRIGSPVTMQKTSNFEEDWGLERDRKVNFPATLMDVVDHSFSAIAGTLYQTHAPDPNIASNAMSRSIFTQRPIRKARDAGRIGLEIDGVELLFPHPYRVSSAAATRRFALLLAAKLSRKESWKSFEECEDAMCNTLDQRPIIVCFNTIKQALAASSELQQLRQLYFREQINQSGTSPYDKVKIQCIHDEIPKELHLDPSQRRRNNGLIDGFVNATKGLILVVQPTDYNEEFKPPGPAIDSIGNFQKLAARATIEETPIVALSPRFLSNKNAYGGWDQSGYQMSATYGGIEPPQGPTPWIMRDFTPPAFCWIANALPLARSGPRRIDGMGEQCYLSRVALTQSVMDPGHLWNVFVAKECRRGTSMSPVDYVFLASTRSAAGRPPRAVLQRIVEDC